MNRVRLFLWLGMPFTVFCLILGGYLLFFRRFPEEGGFLRRMGIPWTWMMALFVVMAAIGLPILLLQNRPKLNALSRMSPEQFRFVLVPHLAACGSYLAFCAGLVIVGGTGIAKPGSDLHWLPGSLLLLLMMGGLFGGLFSLKWSQRRWNQIPPDKTPK